jgi:AraC-like DNA-binding protein
MITLLDSRQLSAAERGPAAVAARLQERVSSRVLFDDAGAPVHARLGGWDLGGLAVLRSDVTGGLSLRQPGPEPTPVLSLWIQDRGVGRHEQGGVQRLLPRGALALTELTSPYGFAWSTGGTGGGRALQIPLARLGLPVDTLRRAVPAVRASPLHDLVRGHVARLTADPGRFAQDPGLPALAEATVELVRALLLSAAGPYPGSRAVLAETLATRVRGYVRRHGAEADLDAERVARVHAVSVRQLYRACAAAGFSLEQEIIGRRLAGARAELVAPAGRDRSIAAVARRWGFADPSHFARRFRAAYGTTPREFRRAGSGVPGTPPRPGS